jgi:hypothetical protein
LNLDRSTHTLIPRGEIEEEPVVEGLNIGADREGDPTEETPIIGELAAALGNAYECDESEPAVEE